MRLCLFLFYISVFSADYYYNDVVIIIMTITIIVVVLCVKNVFVHCH